MTVIERPGIYPRWETSWKTTHRNNLDLVKMHGQNVIQALEHYAAHGKTLVRPLFPRNTPEWKSSILTSDLFFYALQRHCQVDNRAMLT